MNQITAERRRRLTHRLLPAVGGLAAVSVAAGALVGASANSAGEQAAKDFTEAWQRGDFRAMHSLLTDDARADEPFPRFREAYAKAAATATLRGIEAGEPEGEKNGEVTVPVVVRTTVFGRLRGQLVVPASENGVAWVPRLVFPSLRDGETLRRESIPPERAPLRSRNGRVLARGQAGERSSPLEGIADSIAGEMEPAETKAERRALYAQGFPRDWPVGQTGLERAFERELRGTPGGELLAGERVLARARPRPAAPVRTTIDTRVQEAAVTALAGRFGGIAALHPDNGEVLALAGIAFSAPQPPGSTFKIVTATAALEQGVVRPKEDFPVESAAIVDGVELENANGEFCGGTFRETFAHSCNSVFGPLGVEVGSEELVAAAERFGWNAKPTIPGEVSSSIPPASEIVSPLEVASTAIGQFRTLATPLQMASVAQTIAADGVRYPPTLRLGEKRPGIRVTSPEIANLIGSMMVEVVQYGTGVAAATPGIKVAGKTGTAELEDTRGPDGETLPPDPNNTDAWFAAYAPVRDPAIALGVMFVRAGSGGATAAPAARVVLEESL